MNILHFLQGLVLGLSLTMGFAGFAVASISRLKINELESEIVSLKESIR